jgi:hypothetical protein
VAEYFSPRAKQRLCLSQYESVGHHALGMFPQAAPDMWQCDLCGTKSGKGFGKIVANFLFLLVFLCLYLSTMKQLTHANCSLFIV